MGLFDKIFKKKEQSQVEQSNRYTLLDGHVPHFTGFTGDIYTSELIRTAIDARARHISKLDIVIKGSALPALTARIKHSPNDMQTWGQFLYRLSTILDVRNTAFIVPLLDVGEITGYYTICPDEWELRDVYGEPWIRFSFGHAKHAAIELSKVGIMTKYQYSNDLFGSSNEALKDTLSLIKIQRQGVQEYAKNASSYRFYAKMNNFVKPEDLQKERERFDSKNFATGGGGLLLFPNTYSDITQISPQSYAVNAAQLRITQENVYNYFGVNADILQNKAYSDKYTAFYEGAIEPFAVQLADVMTNMTYSKREQSYGARIYFTANKLQYMSNSEKLSVSKDMLDRGIMSLNEVREIWQLPPVEGGDQRIIRGEYYNADKKVGE